jgi:hypothetical protein
MDFREIVKFRDNKNPFLKSFFELYNVMESLCDPTMAQPLEEDIDDQNIRRSGLLYFRDNITLSIFGSNTAYSIPRKNVDIYQYRALEIAFLDHESDEFVDLTKSEELQDFKGKYALGEFYCNGVYRLVPINIIQELFDFLTAKYGLIIKEIEI